MLPITALLGENLRISRIFGSSNSAEISLSTVIRFDAIIADAIGSFSLAEQSSPLPIRSLLHFGDDEADVGHNVMINVNGEARHHRIVYVR